MQMTGSLKSETIIAAYYEKGFGKHWDKTFAESLLIHSKQPQQTVLLQAKNLSENSWQ